MSINIQLMCISGRKAARTPRPCFSHTCHTYIYPHHHQHTHARKHQHVSPPYTHLPLYPHPLQGGGDPDLDAISQIVPGSDNTRLTLLGRLNGLQVCQDSSLSLHVFFGNAARGVNLMTCRMVCGYVLPCLGAGIQGG